MHNRLDGAAHEVAHGGVCRVKPVEPVLRCDPCPHRPAAPVTQHGVGVLLPDCRAALDGERAEPQPRLEAVHASALGPGGHAAGEDRKSTRLNSSHVKISYAVFCLKKKIMHSW